MTSARAAISAERWKLIAPYLDRALDLEAGARTAWLASVDADDPTLAAELRSLLEERRVLSGEGFLEAQAPPHPVSSLAGEKVGAYRLESPIGQGGMGTVWRARRSDGRFEGTAAVKLLNASLLGHSGEDRFRR